MIKKFFQFLFVLIVLGGAGFLAFKKFQPQLRTYVPIAGPCDSPFEYSIGRVDPRFNIDSNEVATLAHNAESIWEKQSGKDLFLYNPAAQFKINLVFDERQRQSLEAADLEEKLEKLKITDTNLKAQYDQLYAQYQAKLSAYDSAEKKYSRDLADYNKEVSYWNARGGAPSEEYEKLKDEQDDLDAALSDLKKKQKELNSLIVQLNSLASQQEKIIGNYNKSVATYRSKYGGSREFEKGFFNGQEINIYQFNEDSDLKLTLAHELGHALGIGHVENPQSLMYYLIGEQDLDNPILTDEDKAELKNICEL